MDDPGLMAAIEDTPIDKTYAADMERNARIRASILRSQGDTPLWNSIDGKSCRDYEHGLQRIKKLVADISGSRTRIFPFLAVQVVDFEMIASFHGTDREIAARYRTLAEACRHLAHGRTSKLQEELFETLVRVFRKIYLSELGRDE